jgi:DnaK suppressor protein
MNLDATRRELEVRRERIAGELAALTEPPEAGVNLSFGKRVGDGTTEAVERFASTATARSLAGTLTHIERALEKIAEGTYGVCDDCGGRISEERLEARPATARCVECSAAR